MGVRGVICAHPFSFCKISKSKFYCENKFFQLSFICICFRNCRREFFRSEGAAEFPPPTPSFRRTRAFRRSEAEATDFVRNFSENDFEPYSKDTQQKESATEVVLSFCCAPRESDLRHFRKGSNAGREPASSLPCRQAGKARQVCDRSLLEVASTYEQLTHSVISAVSNS